VVNGPVTSSDGTVNPNLRVYFAVRAYAGNAPGTIGHVRTDIIVENSDAFAPQGQPQYTATLSSGSADYTSPPLTQYTATRWHKVLWWNDAEPKVYLQQDTQYIQASMAVSRYMPLKADEGFLASRRQSCDPLDHCDQTKTMSNTGAQPAIGPLPRWTSVYILDPDVRAYNWMLANTDALGTYSIHYRDQATGWPVSIQNHPYVTLVNWANANRIAQQNNAKGMQYKADLLPNCTPNAVVTSCSTAWYGTGNPYMWNVEHQPAQSYVPYMVTGSWYYMSELAFGASLNNMWSSENYREYSKGLIDRSHSSVRAKAWALRDLAEAAYLLPDSYPLKSEFNAVVRNSLADWNAKYSDNPHANPLHITDDSAIYNANGGKKNAIAPWQHNFLTWAVGHAAELGFADAAPFRDWLSDFEIGLMTDWQTNPARGYCWLEASSYNIQVKDRSGNWLPSYTAVYATNFPTLVGLACNSQAMVKAMSSLEKKSIKVGVMDGYPNSATGYPANYQIGLAAAVDSGLPGAATAWEIFESRTVKPNGQNAYNNYPNFAVLPRFTAGQREVPSFGPTRNITLPVDMSVSSSQGTAQPAVTLARRIAYTPASSADATPAKQRPVQRTTVIGRVMGLVRAWRIALPNFVASWLQQSATTESVGVSALSSQQTKTLRRAAAPVAQPIQLHPGSIAGPPTPSTEIKAGRQPSAGGIPPMFFAMPACQSVPASGVPPRQCVSR
jgi:hypothetical protein